MSDWIVVLGRFVPLGEKHLGNLDQERRTCARAAALLMPSGEPICQTVRLERIVQPFAPVVSAEQAEKEFLALTSDME